MRLLERNPKITQRELGVGLGKVKYCVRALLAKCFFKLQNFRGSSNKLTYAPLLAPKGIAAKSNLALSFLQIKIAEYERLFAEIEQLKREIEVAPPMGESVNGIEVT
jgi:EPS-associated MarR family transcriptional regulator